MDFTQIATTLIPATASLFAGGQVGDLVALADVKQEIDLTTTANDAWPKKVISRASSAAANYCNRNFYPQTWQDQIWPAKGPYPWQVPPRLAPLQLSQYPLASPPSPAGTAPPLAPTLSPSSGGALATAKYFVRVTYVTSTGETAASVESELAVAANGLLQVAAPGADINAIATGWNCYVSTKSFGETLQNATPIGINNSWTEPTSGLVAGQAPPAYALVVENSPLFPTPLCEGSDFIANGPLGQLTRLFSIDRQPKPWQLPVLAIYQAPYSEIPDDVQDAVLLLVKARYYARKRDPMIRQENAAGIAEFTYWFGTGPGGPGDLPVDVAAKLDRYRVAVVA